MNDEPISNPSVLAPAGLPSVGELLRSSLARYRAHWKLWVLIVLPAAIVGALYAVLFPTPAPGTPSEELSMVGVLTFSVILGVVQFVTTLALLSAVADPITVKEAYRRSAGLLIPYLFIGLLSGLIIMGGFILLVIPGILFSLWFGLAPYVLVAERTRGMNALLKSKSYVSGHLGAVFGRLFILILVSIIVSLLLSILPEPVPSVLISLFLMPFATIYCFKIYEGLKVIKGAVPDVYTTREKAIYIGIGVVGCAALLVIMAVATVLSQVSL